MDKIKQLFTKALKHPVSGTIIVLGLIGFVASTFFSVAICAVAIVGFIMGVTHLNDIIKKKKP